MALGQAPRVHLIAAIIHASEERVVHGDERVDGHDRDVLTGHVSRDAECGSAIRFDSIRTDTAHHLRGQSRGTERGKYLSVSMTEAERQIAKTP